ncbi:isochorismatase family protein [Compostimonas suwonensis]|uniref:Nicotinamidase-related amidase n=1 Tax=Compostimonas suwonensis TaxID=1048394 RepID=A0A2M9BWI9_9MICO|nr:isochorismatase family protein [Compostimonas suwonensis]PJJ62311.1 nicotinamidase-related amidase [Compostimonas suwonensis]
MTLTTLDPATALVVIDLQNGVLAIPKAHPNEQIVANAAALADAFRHHGLPVVLVRVAGGSAGRTEQPPRAGQGELPAGWADLIPELNQQPSDHEIVKRAWGAFHETDLHEHLTGLGVTQLVLAGVSTSIGVETTARHAYEHGYNVTLAVDAMTDSAADAHEHTVTRIFPRLGETGTTEEIIELLGTIRP